MSSSKPKSQKPPLNYGSPCAACKFLRRKCLPDCIFAPHFPADQPQKFELVHKIYGASNISKILNQLSYDLRDEAVKSLVYEAEARVNEPVYGCVGFIAILQLQLRQLQTELSAARRELSTYMVSKTPAANFSVPQSLQMPRDGSSSSFAMTRPLSENTRKSLYELMPQRMTMDGRSSSQQAADQLLEMSFDASHRFNTNDRIQLHVLDQMLYEQKLQRSFGNQQPATAEQKPPTTTRPP